MSDLITMRADSEILVRIEKVRSNDLFGVEKSNLIEALSFDAAKPFLKDDYQIESEREGWENQRISTKDSLVAAMNNYFEFAVEKAEHHRGLSASRSISHFKAWLWLLMDDDLVAFAENDENHTNYGVPILNAISKKYGFKESEEEWFSNMAQGKPCYDGCSEGCG